MVAFGGGLSPIIRPSDRNDVESVTPCLIEEERIWAPA
jgi:hypothetical protein